MKSFFRKPRSEPPHGSGKIHELEALRKTARWTALSLPLLVLAGIGAGNVTARNLDLPEETPVRDVTEDAVPLGRFEALRKRLARISDKGENAEEYARVYRNHIRPVEEVLTRRGMARRTARRAAWPLVEQTYRNGLDVATVLSIILVESNFQPNATSSEGARGLMQVMPEEWLGVWRECGLNLYDVEDNICTGTSILAWYLRRHNGDFRRAMLGYNGCVRGVNTPDCHTYPDKVARARARISRELERLRVP